MQFIKTFYIMIYNVLWQPRALYTLHCKILGTVDSQYLKSTMRYIRRFESIFNKKYQLENIQNLVELLPFTLLDIICVKCIFYIQNNNVFNCRAVDFKANNIWNANQTYNIDKITEFTDKSDWLPVHLSIRRWQQGKGVYDENPLWRYLFGV